MLTDASACLDRYLDEIWHPRRKTAEAWWESTDEQLEQNTDMHAKLNDSCSEKRQWMGQSRETSK